MKFKQLKIHNFLTIGNADTVHLDDKGLVLIQGVNEDDSSATSNGVGKSSIPDALCWALYGITARGITGDAVVNRSAKKDCYVGVMFVDGETVYSITRYRKHKEFKNQTVVIAAAKEGEVGVDLSKGTEKETQELINQIMGCSLDVFMAAIYAGQDEMPDLPKMTDKQLKLLIEEAAGLSRLESAYELSRQKLTAAQTARATYASKWADAESRKGGAEYQLEQAKLEVEKFDAERTGVAERYKEEAGAIHMEIVALVKRIKSLDEAENQRIAQELDEQLGADFELRKKERELLADVAKAQVVLTRAQTTAEASKRDAELTAGMIKNAPDEMSKPCPECGKPHTEDELNDYCAVQKDKLTKQIERAKADQMAVSAAKRMVDQAEADLATHRATMPDVSVIAARRRVIEDVLKGIVRDKAQAKSLKERFDRAMQQANDAMTCTNPHASAVALAEKNLASAELVAKDTSERLADAVAQMSLFENVAKVFGPAGVRAHILDSVTPFLNERTGEYLAALSDGNITAVWSTLSTTAKGDLKEKFNIEVDNTKGADSFAGLSGGEKRKVRLSTMLALQDLVASRASKPIDLWIGDEIDDALDSAGLERLMGVLEKKARERGTVLVVSHNELRDWIDQVVTVTKRGGSSIIEGALCDA